MHKLLKLLLVLALLSGAQAAWAQMSERQIVEYITENLAAGKTKNQVGQELLARGVTTAQLQRLFKAYSEGNLNSAVSPVGALPTSKLGTQTRERKTAVEPENAEIERRTVAAKDSVARAERVYGHDIFSGKTLSFEPNMNVATPEDYVLGPGDEIVIDIWGASEASITSKISPEGHVIIPQVGRVILSGLTVKEASGKLKSSLGKIYSSLRSGGSSMSLSLGNVRTIQVNVLGEVNNPGTYRLSSFTTLFNALYSAGGVTEVGSLRNVRVVRGGDTFAEVDVYQYLFDGKLDLNVPLKEGDVIIVPAYSALVQIEGAVKRPMRYEVKDGEAVGKLIEYAGGFTGKAWREEVGVERMDGQNGSFHTVKSSDFGSFGLKDGDVVNVGSSEAEVFTNRVEVSGSVYRPGKYELGKDIATVGQLIRYAGGVLEDAFLSRAQIIREKADRSLELVPVPLGAILDGNVQDILLQRGDVLVVSNANDIDPKGDITITGYVANPGKYQYAEHITVEDLILLAGGLSEGASDAKVDIARRVGNSSSTEASDTLAQVFSVSLKDGLAEDGGGGFELKPNDIVSVRRSPTYIEQRNVSVTGEVTFPGQYTLSSNNERISSLLSRAGGATPKGYLHGAMLRRKINQYELNVRNSLSKIATQNIADDDTVTLKKLKVSEIYTVGIELDKAIAHPGSDYDIVLRDGDELIIPEQASTVRIQGEVFFPNTVHFISGKPVSYYVKQAGGYTNHARRSKTYVLYMNGTVAVGKTAKLEPGCEIVVPARDEKQRLTTAEWLGIGTSAASITTMIATIVSLFR